MTYRLSPEFHDIAAHYGPPGPRAKRLAFTLALVWLGVAGSVVLEFLELRREANA